MVDKVRPLKLETSSEGGTQTDDVPTAANPLQDFVSCRGLAFEGSDSYLLEKVGGVIKDFTPTYSEKAYYTGDLLTAYEVFNGAVQTTPNRLARVDLSYTGDAVTSEVLSIYSLADGTTVLRTITSTYTYSGDDLSNVGVVEV